MTFDQFIEVWNLATFAFAIVAGVALGALAIGHYASDPAYASGEATAFEYGVLVAVLSVAMGLVFFGFQVIATYVAGDPFWTRVVSRFGVWVVYSASIGLGTWARLSWGTRSKHAEARSRSARELDK